MQSETVTYDANSNIKTLMRYGKMNNGNYNAIDVLDYTYDGGNRLYSIIDHGQNLVTEGAFDFKDDLINSYSAPEYGYNCNGSLTYDANKGVSWIDYDQLGNPIRVQFTDHSITEHVYAADGRRLKTIHRTSVPQSPSLGIGVTASLPSSLTQSIDSVDYVGNFIYEKGQLKRYMFDDGYLRLNTNNTCVPRFFIKDHLGNNRILTDGSGNIKQNTNYYPYGGMTYISTNQGEQQFKYNGKEYDPMHGLNEYDYGARQYDPAIGKFTTMDPLCEKYYHISPYAYCGGNPINRIDPTGMDWYQNNQTSYYTWYDGDGAREGFTYIGGKGSLLGEFESKINNILIDAFEDDNGLYSEGRTVDITNPNKGAIIPSQLSQMDDFLDEFVFGYGPEISILTSSHPYTKALQSDDCVIENQQKLRAGNTTIPGQITDVKRSWGPLDALSTTSIAKQFVGSYRFDSYTSNDKKHLLNIICDTKNFRSLFYHILGTEFLNHSRRSIVKPLANTYQFYIWKSKK